MKLISELSKLNRKTLNIKKFKEYIKEKSKMNTMIQPFYERYIFRKLEINRYINIKKHEQKLINRFKEVYGDEKEVIICAGDFEQKKHMKYKEPVKGKGMRKLFRDNGYKVYLVDECRTSCMCSKCENEDGRCEKFIWRKNPKFWKEGNALVHGAVRCKNCKAVWNRDVNAATNIYRIVKKAIHRLSRPDYLIKKSDS